MTSTKIILTLVDKIYASILDENWQSFLNELMEVTRANKVWVGMFDLKSNDDYFVEYVSFIPGFDELFNRISQRIDEDPWMQKSAYISEEEVYVGSQLLSQEQLVEYDFYHEFFVPAQSEYLLGALPIKNENTIGALAAVRGKDDCDFEPSMIEIFQQITPHFNRAFQLYKILKLNENQKNLYHAILQNNPKAMLLCDEHMNVVAMNPACEMFLNQQSDILIRNEKLVSKNIIMQSKLKNFIHSTFTWLSANQPEPRMIAISDKNNAFIQAYPIHPENDFNSTGSPYIVLEFEKSKAISWSLVAEKYQLTKKEVELLKHISTGESLQSAAESLFITYHTVRSHMKNIYSKTLTNSLHQIVSLIYQYTK